MDTRRKNENQREEREEIELRNKTIIKKDICRLLLEKIDRSEKFTKKQNSLTNYNRKVGEKGYLSYKYKIEPVIKKGLVMAEVDKIDRVVINKKSNNSLTTNTRKLDEKRDLMNRINNVINEGLITILNKLDREDRILKEINLFKKYDRLIEIKRDMGCNYIIDKGIIVKLKVDTMGMVDNNKHNNEIIDLDNTRGNNSYYRLM